MRFAFIRAKDEQKTFPIQVMCRVLEVSTSGYYAWLKHKPSKQSQRKAELTVKVKAAHDASRRTYGSPRVTKQLKKAGEKVSEKQVAKNMWKTSLRPVRSAASRQPPTASTPSASRTTC